MAHEEKLLQGASGHKTGVALPDPVHPDEDWYHREMSEDEAEQALKDSNCDCLLIRQSQGVYIFSYIQDGDTHHCEIKSGPGWYKLKGSTHIFNDLQGLVSHYCKQLHLSDLYSDREVIPTRNGKFLP